VSEVDYPGYDRKGMNSVLAPSFKIGGDAMLPRSGRRRWPSRHRRRLGRVQPREGACNGRPQSRWHRASTPRTLESGVLRPEGTSTDILVRAKPRSSRAARSSLTTSRKRLAESNQPSVKF
jgi:hypothetical protein